HAWIRENITDDKPLMLSEFGTASDPDRPQRQAEWYAQVPRVLKNRDGVKAALQWNDRDPGPHCHLALAGDAAGESLREGVAVAYLNEPQKSPPGAPHGPGPRGSPGRSSARDLRTREGRPAAPVPAPGDSPRTVPVRRGPRSAARQPGL